MKLFKTLTCIALLFAFAAGCKKDQLVVNEIKEYQEARIVQLNPFDGGWELALRPDGVADITPGGDIRYRGTYKVNGSKLKVVTPQNSGSYTFIIISETEIREKSSGVTLMIKK